MEKNKNMWGVGKKYAGGAEKSMQGWVHGKNMQGWSKNMKQLLYVFLGLFHLRSR